MSSNTQILTSGEAAAQAPAGWYVDDDVLTAQYRTGNMVKGLDFINRVVAAAEAVNHHPDITFNYGVVGFRLSTHDAGALTTADVELAHTIDEIAKNRGFTPEAHRGSPA